MGMVELMATMLEYNVWALSMGHKYRVCLQLVCREAEQVKCLKWQYVKTVPDTASHACIDNSPKVSLAW